MQQIKLLVSTFLVFICALLPGLATAEQQFVATSLDLGFTPENVNFFVRYSDGSVDQYKAMVSAVRLGKGADPGAARWLTAAVIKISPQRLALGYTIFAEGAGNSYYYVPNLSLDDVHEVPFEGSIDVMKAHTNARSEVLNSLTVQSQTQTDNLKRLRADAEVIANLSRIVEVKDEIEVVKSEIENLDGDLKRLKEIFTSVRAMPAPANYYQRESELTKQQAELRKLVETAEKMESTRQSESQEEIDYKLSLIELTRYEDEDKLRQELIRLKKQPSSTLPTPQQQPVKNYWDMQ